MADCTLARLGPSRVLRTLAATVAVLSLSSIAAAIPARADGDPASDVLATQNLFLPQDAAVPPAQQAQLGALLQETVRSGVPIRVALVGSPSDLGSITQLWRQPAAYASFLGQELSLIYHGTLVVIMPNGFGLYRQNHRLSQHVLAGISIQPRGLGLGRTAEQAIQRLAATAGRPLSLPRARSASATGPSNAIEWVIFAVGLVLASAAWAASLRARPLGSGHQDAPVGR
jgi:hypothetical protein